MLSLYSLYIPKYKDESTEFLITRIISHYARETKYNINILSSPGYMSTTDKTIKRFLDELVYSITSLKDARLGFFYGMNGSRKVPKTSQTIREYHIHEISRNPHIQNIPIACKKDNDHRKCCSFLKAKGGLLVVY